MVLQFHWCSALIISGSPRNKNLPREERNASFFKKVESRIVAPLISFSWLLFFSLGLPRLF